MPRTAADYARYNAACPSSRPVIQSGGKEVNYGKLSDFCFIRHIRSSYWRPINYKAASMLYIPIPQIVAITIMTNRSKPMRGPIKGLPIFVASLSLLVPAPYNRFHVAEQIGAGLRGFCQLIFPQNARNLLTNFFQLIIPQVLHQVGFQAILLPYRTF